MTRPRILLVTSRFPFPVIGGDRLRIFNLLRQLQREFEVSLRALGNPSPEDIEELRRTSGVVDISSVQHPRWRALWGATKALLFGRPLQVGYYESPALAKAVAQSLPGAHLCIFHLIRTSALWRGSPTTPAVLEMCDAISANFAQTAREGRWWSPWRVLSSIEAPRTAAFERREVARFDLVSLHTRKDATTVGIPESKLLISTQGVNISGLSYTPPRARHGRSVAMIGKMDFFPNWHGAEWFGRNVLPLLPAYIRLKVVGDCSSPVRERLEAIPRVDVTGRVESLDQACADCFAAIAPIHVATGIQNKVLEYFAMGLPTVLSPSVASGLLHAATGGFAVAGEAREWAEALQRIASNLDAASAMAEHASQYVRHCHSWDQIGDEYNARLKTLLDGSSNSMSDRFSTTPQAS